MPTPALPKVKLPSGETVPQLGQGTWRMGESARLRKEEVAALKLSAPTLTRLRDGLSRSRQALGAELSSSFTDRVDEAEEILHLAKELRLLVCAGHQLLYEPPTQVLQRYLPSIGRLAHVESYFSFRTVRHAPGGRRVLRADHQLLDILPHPVYLLLRILELGGEGPVQVESLHVSHTGTVHALVRRGDVTGTLVVTLEGRPVESGEPRARGVHDAAAKRRCFTDAARARPQPSDPRAL